MKFGIMGWGVVGQATADAARFHGHDLAFTYDPPQAIQEGDPEACEIVFVCVPTPPIPDSPVLLRKLDTSRVLAAVKWLRDREYWRTVAIRSTVNVGDTRRIGKALGECMGSQLAYNPEFLRRRDAEHTSRWPGYVVLGGRDEKAPAQWELVDFYRPYFEDNPKAPIYTMSFETAEFYKLFSNAMIALTISAAHEMQALAVELGADYGPIYHIAQHCHATPKTVRVDSDSPGWAGPCLPKDVEALCAIGREAGVPLHALEHARNLNDHLRKQCGEGE